jgi:N-acylneuraminate cytidylyltransferase
VSEGASVHEVLAIVPARGGSKGLPRKNIRDFLGRPLVEWSVCAGIAAELVDRVLVSTDDVQIADIARAAGADVPFLRPAELAGDDVTDLPVFEHALSWLFDAEGYVPDLVVHLRPTSPLRPPGLVDEGIRRLLAEPAASSVRIVTDPANNPYKMWRIADGVLVPLVDSGIPEQYNQPRQKLPRVYWQIGTLDVIRTSTITEHGSMSGDRILAMVVGRELAADVDDEESFRAAEAAALRLGLGAQS